MAYKDKAQAVQHVAEYNKKKYDKITVYVPKGQREEIQAAAKEAGMPSMTAYILKAIRLMEAQKERPAAETIPEGD